MRKRLSLLDRYKDEIKKYLELGLSIRCIFLLINYKMQQEGLYISYQAVRKYIAKIKES